MSAELDNFDTCFRRLFLLFAWAKSLLIFWLLKGVRDCKRYHAHNWTLQLQTLVHFAQLVLALNLKWLTTKNYVDTQVKNYTVNIGIIVIAVGTSCQQTFGAHRTIKPLNRKQGWSLTPLDILYSGHLIPIIQN